MTEKSESEKDGPPVIEDGSRYLVWISFMEIYNEHVYDLLEPVSTLKKSKFRSSLKLGEDKKGNTFVKGKRVVFCPVLGNTLTSISNLSRKIQVKVDEKIQKQPLSCYFRLFFVRCPEEC